MIEIDCLNAINLVNESTEEESHPNKILIDDCKELLLEMEARVVHILREANRCADILAHMGGEDDKQEVMMLIPSNKIVKEMMCDMKGVTYGRGT